MTDKNLPLGTIHGIKIRLHWSWGIIFLLVTWSLADGYLPSQFKTWSPAEYWLIGALGALLLFATILVHELSHSFVAQAQGLPIDSITLYLFGGVSNLSREAESPGKEFWMTVAGPLSSLVLGVAFLGLSLLISSPDWLVALCCYLGTINLLLALFNLVPAFPLDGGRILRSVVWATTHDLPRATRTSAGVGRWVAWSVILTGIWLALMGAVVSGLWLALIGWFLQSAAASSRAAAGRTALEGVDVGQVMAPRPLTVSPDTRLDRAVYDYLLHQDERGLPVVAEGRLLGLLSVGDVLRVPAEQWPQISAWRAMTPVERLATTGPDLPLPEALRLLAEPGRTELLVVRDGELVGILSRARAAHYLQVRRDLGLEREWPPTDPAGSRPAA